MVTWQDTRKFMTDFVARARPCPLPQRCHDELEPAHHLTNCAKKIRGGANVLP